MSPFHFSLRLLKFRGECRCRIDMPGGDGHLSGHQPGVKVENIGLARGQRGPVMVDDGALTGSRDCC